jgi:hypothetical protein
LNPKRWGSNTLALTYDLFILLNDWRLQVYVEFIRDCDYVNRCGYNVWDWLYNGRTGLWLIPTKKQL